MKFNMSLLNSETEIKGNGYCCSKNITNFLDKAVRLQRQKLNPKNIALNTYVVSLLNKQGRT